MIESPNDDNEDKVQIFSTADKRIKYLGRILNSDSSMDILRLISKEEMTASEIAEKMHLSLPLTIHHLNKMSKAGIVNIVKTRLNSKNQPMKCYRADKTGILILPDQASKKARTSKSLSNSLRHIMRFSAIGTAGLLSWILTTRDNMPVQPTDSDNMPVQPTDSDNTLIDQSEDSMSHGTADGYGIEQIFEFFLPSSVNVETLLISTAISALVVAAGIGLNVTLVQIFRKKSI